MALAFSGAGIVGALGGSWLNHLAPARLVLIGSYFPEARLWWLAYEAQATQPGREVERELIRRDEGRWLSLGLVVGEKPDRAQPA